MKRWVISSLVLLLLAACAWMIEDSSEGSTAVQENPAWLVLSAPPSGIDSPLCTDEQLTWVTGYHVYQPTTLTEPPARVPYRDPVFGTCMVRVTDRNSDLSADDESPGLKNEYSRVQSFNSDGTLILVRGVDATWYIYSASSLEPLGRVPIDVDPRWSMDDPGIIYFSSETRLMKYDLGDGKTTIVHDFSTDAPGSVIVWSRYEGSPSMDGRYWGLMAQDENWLPSFYIVYDLQTDAVIASMDIRKGRDSLRGADSVTISPLGNYFLVQMDAYCDPGKLGTAAHPCGLMVYDRSLQNGRGLLRVVGHSDTALDANGREVFVYQDNDTDHISMLDLQNGTITDLLPLDFNHTGFGIHISGRALSMPGWVVVSTHDGDPRSYTWMDDSVFAVELKAGGRILRLAHTYSLVDESMEHDYWAEPQASVNQGFTRIIYTTNWNRSGSGQVEMMLLELPSNWIDYLP